jgi:hypothetical protein
MKRKKSIIWMIKRVHPIPLCITFPDTKGIQWVDTDATLGTNPSGIEPDPLLPQRAPYTKGGHFGLTTILTTPHVCEHVPKCEPHSLGQWQWCARSSRLVALLG